MLKTFLLWGLTFLLVQNYISPTLAEKPSKTLSDKEVEVLDALEFNEGPVIITRYSVNVFFGGFAGQAELFGMKMSSILSTIE